MSNSLGSKDSVSRQITGADLVVAIALIAIGVASRLGQDASSFLPPNFHAVMAASLFAGFYFGSRALAACVPLCTMLVSDWLLGGYDWGVMVAVYTAMLLPISLRGFLRSDFCVGRLGLGAVASSLMFYLLSNLAVWYQWYEPTFAGLMRCYTRALPFLAYSLCGELCFTGLIFGAYVLIRRPVLASKLAAAS